MAKFAPVAPLRILKQLRYGGGYYHLLLAHDVLANADEFDQVFSQRGGTIILDNSVVELGRSVDAKTIEKAAEACHATVVILPDEYNDWEGTIKNCDIALQTWPRSLLNRDVMMVPQGNTMEQFLLCAEHFAKDPRITWWGVPRNLTDKPAFSTRYNATMLLHSLNPSRKIHLLGFSDKIYDDMLTATLSFVEGIDSAVPIRAASLNMPMSMALKMPPRGNWWQNAEYVPMMDQNLDTTRMWANGFSS